MESNKITPQITDLNTNQNNNADVKVVTIFFNGTCSSILDATPRESYPNGETISAMRHNTKGITFGFDGPGSGSAYHDEKYYASQQIATGAGIEINIERALEQLRILKKEFPNLKVNLCGWSRGAAAAISCASNMFKDPTLKDIPVNLFAIDPVPGLGNVTTDHTVLQENVKEAVIVLAKDERSIGFGAVVPVRDEKNKTTKINLLPMPGHHASQVGNPFWRNGKEFKGEKVNFPEVGQVVRWLLEQFLLRHGTIVEDSLKLKRDNILELLKKIKSDEKKYETLRKEAYTACQVLGQARKVSHGKAYLNQYLDEAVGRTEFQRSDEFVNSLHAYLSKHNDLKNYFEKHTPLQDSWVLLDEEPIPRNTPLPLSEGEEKTYDNEKLLEQAKDYDAETEKLSKQLSLLQEELEKSRADNFVLKKQIDDINNILDLQSETQKALELSLQEKSAMLLSLEQTMKDQQTLIDQLSANLHDNHEALVQREKAIDQKGLNLVTKEDNLQKQEDELNRRDQALRQKEQALRQKEQALLEKESKLTGKSTTSHKTTSKNMKKEMHQNPSKEEQSRESSSDNDDQNDQGNNRDIEASTREKTDKEQTDNIKDNFVKFIKKYTKKENRGIFHRHRQHGRDVAQALISHIQNQAFGNTDAFIETLRKIMQDQYFNNAGKIVKLDGNFNPGSLKTYLLAFYLHLLQEKINSNIEKKQSPPDMKKSPSDATTKLEKLGTRSPDLIEYEYKWCVKKSYNEKLMTTTNEQITYLDVLTNPSLKIRR